MPRSSEGFKKARSGGPCTPLVSVTYNTWLRDPSAPLRSRFNRHFFECQPRSLWRISALQFWQLRDLPYDTGPCQRTRRAPASWIGLRNCDGGIWHVWFDLQKNKTFSEHQSSSLDGAERWPATTDWKASLKANHRHCDGPSRAGRGRRAKLLSSPSWRTRLGLGADAPEGTSWVLEGVAFRRGLLQWDDGDGAFAASRPGFFLPFPLGLAVFVSFSSPVSSASQSLTLVLFFLPFPSPFSFPQPFPLPRPRPFPFPLPFPLPRPFPFDLRFPFPLPFCFLRPRPLWGLSPFSWSSSKASGAAAGRLSRANWARLVKSTWGTATALPCGEYNSTWWPVEHGIKNCKCI